MNFKNIMANIKKKKIVDVEKMWMLRQTTALNLPSPLDSILDA